MDLASDEEDGSDSGERSSELSESEEGESINSSDVAEKDGAARQQNGKFAEDEEREGPTSAGRAGSRSHARPSYHLLAGKRPKLSAHNEQLEESRVGGAFQALIPPCEGPPRRAAAARRDDREGQKNKKCC